MRMREFEINDYARQLLDAHGSRAIVEAAQKAYTTRKRSDGRSPNLETHRSSTQTDARTTRKLIGFNADSQSSRLFVWFSNIRLFLLILIFIVLFVLFVLIVVVRVFRR